MKRFVASCLAIVALNLFFAAAELLTQELTIGPLELIIPRWHQSLSVSEVTAKITYLDESVPTSFSSISDTNCWRSLNLARHYA